MKTTVVFIPFNVMLLLHNSNSFSLNVAKTLLLSAWLDSSTALNTPFTIPDNVLTMHPVFIPKRAEISKVVKDKFFDDFDSFIDKDFRLFLDDDEDLLKNLRSFKPNINQIPVDIRNTGKSYQIL